MSTFELFEFLSFLQRYELVNKYYIYYIDDENDIDYYLPYNYSTSKYAVPIQLKHFIQNINMNIERRPEIKENYIPKGNCAFLNQSIISVNTYFTKNNLSLEKFLEIYSNYKFIFKNNTFERLKEFSNNYEMLEKNIRRFARENIQVKPKNSVIIL